MKKPYVKIYDTQGVCINPITKENPYLHKADSMLLKKEKEKANQRIIKVDIASLFLNLDMV